MDEKRVALFTILGVLFLLGSYFVFAQATTVNSPTASSTIYGVYTLNATNTNLTDITNCTFYFGTTATKTVLNSTDNYTTTGTAATTTWNTKAIADGTYTITARCTNNTWYENGSVSSVTINNTVIYLETVDTSYYSTENITFNYTPTSNALINNCTLYLYYSNTSLVNNTAVNSTYAVLSNYTTTTYDPTNISLWNMMDHSLYTWNYKCCTNESKCEFASANRTLTIDTIKPIASLTQPSDTSIDVLGSIKYTCDGTDTTSGVTNCTITIAKPDGTSVIKTCTCGMEELFTSTDTNKAGTYTITCSVADNTGWANTDAGTFTTTYATVTTGGGGGGGQPPTFDIDLSTGEESTMKEQQGVIKTFTLDGVTEHTISVIEVTASTVTLEIASDPIIVTLNIGQTKEVDIDGDGVNDISVTLNSITNSVADITTKLLALAEVTPAGEEVTPAGEEVTPEGEISRTGLWITIIVIVIILVIGYLIIRKRK
jgi:hypothetical protein